tara:strand:- start:103 stop:258 length:156 start_codon:yes stop_codon:yes gene_type:complete
MEDLKVYGLSIYSLLLSGVEKINNYLQMIVLFLTIVYTIIQIVKKLKNGKN